MTDCTIEIFGLPRSGTNYLQFMVRQNFACHYENKYDFNTYLRKKTALKHCKPVNNGSTLFLLILKNEQNFINSYKKWDKKARWFGGWYAKRLYRKAIVDYIEFLDNTPNAVLLGYEMLVSNEEKYLRYISEKFSITLQSEKIIVPEKRMDKSGGLGMVEEPFKVAFSSTDYYPEIQEKILQL